MNRYVLVFAFTAFTLLPTPQFGGTAGLPPFEYVDVSLDRGIGPYRWAEADLSQQRGTRWGGGVVAADFDDDGDTDIFVSTDRGMVLSTLAMRFFSSPTSLSVVSPTVLRCQEKS